MTDRITAEQYKAKAKKGNKRVKNATRVEVPEGNFDSKREYRRWLQLKAMENAGEIVDLERQYPIHLMGQQSPIMTDTGKQVRRYFADFRYFDVQTGAWVIEDAKGHPTEKYKLVRSILSAMNLHIKEV